MAYIISKANSTQTFSTMQRSGKDRTFFLKRVLAQAVNGGPGSVIARIYVIFLRIAPTAVRILTSEKIFDPRLHVRIALIVAEGAQSIEKLAEKLSIAIVNDLPEIPFQVFMLGTERFGRQAVFAIVVKRVNNVRDCVDHVVKMVFVNFVLFGIRTHRVDPL